MRLRVTTRTATLTCPHLGLASDPFNHKPGASDDHRCYAEMGRERIDLGHQRRFCLSSAHGSCPFLMVSPSAPRRTPFQQLRFELRQTRAGRRNVSPVRPALSAAQLGQAAELVAAAAAYVWPYVQLGITLGVRFARSTAALVLQTWQTVRPQRTSAVEVVHEFTLAPVVAEAPVEVAHKAPPMEVAFEPTPVEMIEETTPIELILDPTPVIRSSEDAADLVCLGITAVEEGRETEAYNYFKRATQRDNGDVAAWFWRAKTAETLDEVIDCLQRANRIDPENALVRTNMEWATGRREASKELEKALKAAEKLAQTPAHTQLRQKRPSLLKRALRNVGDLFRTVLGLVTLALGVAWILSGLPAAWRDIALGPIGLSNAPLPDASRVTATVHIPLGGGYDAASALPYWIGFFALFVGVGLLNRERWTRLWAPAVLIASAWLIAG